MTESGFLETKRIRPGSVAAVILLHGAAITALLMAKGYVPAPESFGRLRVTPIDLEQPPPPEPPKQLPQPREQVPRWTAPPVPRPTESPFTVPDRPPVPPPDLGSQASEQEVRGVPDSPPEPRPAPPPPTPIVRRDAVLISGDLQPAYPTSEQRAEREGTVVIRVVVGPDGRVKSAEKVRATSDAFYEATERHARSRWRFRPATVDGQPVEARKTLTVVFRLDDT
jgi:protein TonB